MREARKLAIGNVQLLDRVITDDAPLVGLEPSALLGFRDEVPDLPDRIIAATAHVYGIPVLTRDGRIRSSNVRSIW